MAIVRVQQRLHLANAPAFGKWNVYSSAYFQTSTVVPSSTVKDLLQRFFWGGAYTGTSSSFVWHTMAPFVSSTNSGLLTTWEWSGTALVKLDDYPITPINWGTGGVRMPSQACVAIGYRAPQTGNPQKGRSRFWVGPLELTGANITSSGLGYRMTPTMVDLIVSNMVGTIGALTTAGWQLMVKSGSGGGTTFAAANEVYVDDVFDVQRSRRAHTVYQARSAI